ncbi:hypothetical protein MJO29_005499, partial [Puccinia striiformis f. sp. tritici]
RKLRRSLTLHFCQPNQLEPDFYTRQASSSFPMFSSARSCSFLLTTTNFFSQQPTSQSILMKRVPTVPLPGDWSGGRELCHTLALPTKIAGEVKDSNTYLKPIFKRQRSHPLKTTIQDHLPIWFSGVLTIVTLERFIVNNFESQELIQVIVNHNNKLLLGWDYCHVEDKAKTSKGSQTTYVGSYQGSERTDCSVIIQAKKSIINFTVAALSRKDLEFGINLSDDFN